MKRKLVCSISSVCFLIIIYVVARLISGSYDDAACDDNSEQESNKRNVTIAIDCGHGGIDSGKVGIEGQLEKDINLSIGLKLKCILEEDGFDVIMTREEDTGLYTAKDSNKKAADLKARCQLINDSCAAIAVSIHQNSYTSSSVRGAQIFYYSKSAEGKELAECIKQAFCEKVSSNSSRPIKANSEYYLLINIHCPTVIAECGFLSNREEAKLLSDDEYQRKVAFAIYKGIKEYLCK